jgi:hypothetical protein
LYIGILLCYLYLTIITTRGIGNANTSKKARATERGAAIRG